jgi:hypothetical protein
MEYALAIAVLLVLLFRMLNFSSANRYGKMTGRECETEAKPVSPLGGVMRAVQRLIDPAHRVEHTQQATEPPEDEKGPGASPHPRPQ